PLVRSPLLLLPSFLLVAASSLLCTLSLHDALPISCPFVVLAVPSQTLRGIWQALAPRLGEGHLIINAAKGIELSSGLRLYEVLQDRKSTRLNSSHVKISYAVFCWKKKTIRRPEIRQ